jgi:hypothetical protein
MSDDSFHKGRNLEMTSHTILVGSVEGNIQGLGNPGNEISYSVVRRGVTSGFIGTTLVMKIVRISLRVVALCVLFDVSSAVPARYKLCSNQRSEHKNCDFGGAHRRGGDSGLMVYKAGQKHHQQDNTYPKP